MFWVFVNRNAYDARCSRVFTLLPLHIVSAGLHMCLCPWMFIVLQVYP